MRIDVAVEPITALHEYAGVPIGFVVDRIADVSRSDGAGYGFSERRLDQPYFKDYDALGEGPADWPSRFDVSNLTLIGARVDGRRVGGAAIVFDTPGQE